MNNPEFDTFVIGLAVGGSTCLWLGYRLRVRVERWRAGRAVRASKRARQAAKHIPFPLPGAGTIPAEQDARAVLRKPRHVPLDKRPKVNPQAPWVSPSAEIIPIVDPDKVSVAPIPIAPGGVGHPPTQHDLDEARVVAAETVRIIRADALAALTGAGYKRAAAEAALDACTMVERAGGLEHWVAAAFRRLAAKS